MSRKMSWVQKTFYTRQKTEHGKRKIKRFHN